MKLHDGTCRGNNAGELWELIEKEGPATIGALAYAIRRSTRYVHSLVQESDDLTICKDSKFVRLRMVDIVRPWEKAGV